jgi:hypothetical protein
MRMWAVISQTSNIQINHPLDGNEHLQESPQFRLSEDEASDSMECILESTYGNITGHATHTQVATWGQFFCPGFRRVPLDTFQLHAPFG